jgi:predicted nucleic acid-binding protein
MKQFVLDANALVRYFRNEEGALKVSKLLVQADSGSVALSISAINLAEVLYVAARSSSVEWVRAAIRKIQPLVKCAVPETENALAAGELRLRYKLGLADSFAAELTMRMGATLVTADPEFARLGKQLKILTLPRHSA